MSPHNHVQQDDLPAKTSPRARSAVLRGGPPGTRPSDPSSTVEHGSPEVCRKHIGVKGSYESTPELQEPAKMTSSRPISLLIILPVSITEQAATNYLRSKIEFKTIRLYGLPKHLSETKREYIISFKDDDDADRARASLNGCIYSGQKLHVEAVCDWDTDSDDSGVDGSSQMNDGPDTLEISALPSWCDRT